MLAVSSAELMDGCSVGYSDSWTAENWVALTVDLMAVWAARSVGL